MIMAAGDCNINKIKEIIAAAERQKQAFVPKPVMSMVPAMPMMGFAP